MTFEEWWQDDDIECADYDTAKEAWHYQQERIDELVTKVEWLQSVINNAMLPEGCAVVSVSELKLIEDAIAFELGGEPCGLHAAHDLVKAMIQSSKN